MNKSIPYTIKTNGAITLYLNGECLTVAIDHPNYNKVVDALKRGEFDKIDNLVNVAKAVTSFARGQITINNGQIYFGSFALHNTLTDRIIKMMNEGFKFDHMVRFLENLLNNPSNRAVNETYRFLENYGLPITDDGCFLAYKAVRNDYKDIYSGKLDNSVGKTVSMPRNMVDEVYERDCSTGLHVGALDYVVQYGHFIKGGTVTADGNRLLIVKVNPKDVVSVPQYESHPKMRVSEYVVVSEIKDIVKELDKVVYTSKAETLAPDMDEPSIPLAVSGKAKNKVDTTSPWNHAKYVEGWEDAQHDIDLGLDYGTSRDYSEENSYRLGYNDNFNGRPNKATEEQVSGGECDCTCDDCSGTVSETSLRDEDNDYNRGYVLGGDDDADGCYYGENLPIDASDDFKDGYADGYNS
jgi:hypothetical protein